MDEQLIEYVEKYLKAYSADQIKQTLIKGGHSAREVDDVIAHVQSKSPTAPPKPTHPKPLKPVQTQPTKEQAKEQPAQPGVYADFGIRLGAYALDFVIIALCVVATNMLFEIFTAGLSPQTTLIFTIAVPLLIYLLVVLIIAYLEGTYGWSPGKYLLDLRVVNEQKKPIGFAPSLIRNLV
ncbi:MAG: RDD family protein, partial [Candidatus Nanoarchaeia archaeon]